MTILVTGGAGFVGSNLAIRIKSSLLETKVVAFDNLKRRGSELSLTRLKSNGVEFFHGDVRSQSDIAQLGPIEAIIDCAAEPSVLAGLDGATQYLVDTNLVGTVNLLETAKKYQSKFILLSSSRIYPFKVINNLKYLETETRFELDDPSLSRDGISEDFPLAGERSLYGATKLSSELLLAEYASMFDFDYVVNRCGVIAGPWQMGKVDQGFLVLWVARHIFNGELRFTGFGGKGKQTRDLLHIDDLGDLIIHQLKNGLPRDIFNVGGGYERLVSLLEVTKVVEEITGNRIKIAGVSETHPNDCIYYCTNNRKVSEHTGWRPKRTVETLVSDIANWINSNKALLSPILG